MQTYCYVVDQPLSIVPPASRSQVSSGMCCCGINLDMWDEPTLLSQVQTPIFLKKRQWITGLITGYKACLTSPKGSHRVFILGDFLKSTLDSLLSLTIFAIKFQNFLSTPETENCLHLVDKGEKKKLESQLLFWEGREIDMFAFPLINSCSNTQDGSLNIADFGLNDLRNKHKGKL